MLFGRAHTDPLLALRFRVIVLDLMCPEPKTSFVLRQKNAKVPELVVISGSHEYA